MTLNLTVVTKRCIYQCADFRLTDCVTLKPMDSETQKIVMAQGENWTATVCFVGVGKTAEVNVFDWLDLRS